MPSGRHDRDQPAEPASGPQPGRRRAGRTAARVAGTRPGRQAVHVARCARTLACLATYAPSTGATRTSAVLGRAAGEGGAALHSHPGGSGWQDVSGPDYDTERS